MEKHIKNKELKNGFYGYAATPAGEQLMNEVLKIVTDNKLSVTDAESVLDAVHEVIRHTSLNQPLCL